MTMSRGWRTVVLAGAAVLALGACAATPVRYYTLAGASSESTPGVTPASGAGGDASVLLIEVAPVGVPERLARPQMLIRNAGGDAKETVGPQVDVLEQQRWTSSLDSELRDAFAGAIASRAGAVDVTRGGRLPGAPVYRIAIRVGHLDAILDRRVDAVFGWTITRSDDSRHAICEVSVSQPAGKGMDALVQSMKQVVARAAERIADQVAQLQANGSAACDSGANAGSRPAAAGLNAGSPGRMAEPPATIPTPAPTPAAARAAAQASSKTSAKPRAKASAKPAGKAPAKGTTKGAR